MQTDASTPLRKSVWSRLPPRLESMCLRRDSLGNSANERGSSPPHAPHMVHLRCLVCSHHLDGRDDAGVFVVGRFQRRENDCHLGDVLYPFFLVYLEEAIYPRSDSRSESTRRYARRQTLDELLDYSFMRGELWGAFRIRFSRGREDAATKFAVLCDRVPLDPLVVAAAGLVVIRTAVNTLTGEADDGGRQTVKNGRAK
jgi:hypothetical protein